MTIGDKMKQLRQSIGWSQQRFADELGEYPAQQISRWEVGDARPGYYALVKLHRIYKTQVPNYKAEDLLEL